MSNSCRSLWRVAYGAVVCIAFAGGCATVDNTWADVSDVGTRQDSGRIDGGVIDTGAHPDVVAHDTHSSDMGSGCVPTVPTGSHEDTNALCSDGIDNDCDGLTDCADPYCGPGTPAVTVCAHHDAGRDSGSTGSDGCVRTIPAGSHEDTDALCSDGIDNDCNGYADCNDFSCSRSTTVTVCPHDGGATDVVIVADTGVDASSDTGTGFDAGTCPATLVVNEVQTTGAAGAGDEFVEIYNASDCAASLTGWTLRYASATGTTSTVHWTGAATDTIVARGYAVIAGGAYTGTSIGVLTGGTTGALSATAGGIGVFNPAGTRVDSVGYGSTATNSLVEGTPAQAPGSSQSIQRNPDGTDSNDNATDFHVATPTPRAANH